jgi:hypothetical protein
MGTFKTSVGFQCAFRAARQRVTVLVVGNFRVPSSNTPDAWNPPSITQVPDRCETAMGALIADGMRWSAQTEAAMTHGGGGTDRGEVRVLLY